MLVAWVKLRLADDINFKVVIIELKGTSLTDRETAKHVADLAIIVKAQGNKQFEVTQDKENLVVRIGDAN